MSEENAHVKEIKLNPPQEFNGDRTKTKEFVNSVRLHMVINPKIFSTDQLKKAYTLSFMKGGTAGPWAQAEINRLIANVNTLDTTISVGPTTTPSLETFEVFLIRLEKEFSDSVSKLSAQMKLQTLRQGGKPVDDYISEFRTAAINSGITEDAALILMFRRGLNRPI